MFNLLCDGSCFQRDEQEGILIAGRYPVPALHRQMYRNGKGSSKKVNSQHNHNKHEKYRILYSYRTGLPAPFKNMGKLRSIQKTSANGVLPLHELEGACLSRAVLSPTVDMEAERSQVPCTLNATFPCQLALHCR